MAVSLEERKTAIANLVTDYIRFQSCNEWMRNCTEWRGGKLTNKLRVLSEIVSRSSSSFSSFSLLTAAAHVST